MSLYAYNKTTSPLVLAAGGKTLPASTAAGVRSKPFDVSGEFKPLSSGQFASLQAQVAAGSCEYEWTGLPEFNTYSLVVGSAQEDVVQNCIIYVDATSGDDNTGVINDPTRPFKTIEKIYTLVPVGWFQKMRFDFAPGTYTCPPPPFNLGIGAVLGGTSEPFTFVGKSTNELGDQTSDFVSGKTLIGNTALSLTADQYFGAFILMLPGSANAGERRMVRRSTTDGKFEVNVPFTNPLVTGDQFRIQRPAVTIVGDAFNGLGVNGVMAFKDIKFQSTGTFFLPQSIIDGMSGCEVDMQGTGAFILSDGTTLILGATMPNDVFDPSKSAPAGVWFHDGICSAFYSSAFGSGGSAMFSNVFVDTDTSSAFEINNIAAKQTTIYIKGAHLSLDVDDPTYPGFIDGDLFLDPTLGIVNFEGNSSTGFEPIANIDISNSLGHGMLINGRSFINLEKVTGANNAGVGCKVVGMSQASYVPGVTTISGLINDVKIGTLAPQTWASVGAGVSDNLDRIEPIV